MPTAWDVYAQELLPLGYGYPLWDPSPDPHTGEVEIGDVGFIENGQFVRLFNPTLPREHPVNRVWGLPKDFRQLDIADRLVFDKDLTFSSDSLCSRHVTKAEVNAKLDVDSAVDVALKYNTASSSGAILYLPTKSARRREVLRDSTIMHDYLQKNYKAWHHHLHHHNKLKVNKKDLLFVRGYVKTARWAVAAFADSSREEGATVGGGHGPAKTSFSIDLSRQEALGGWTNVGLKREKDKADQCVFVQFLQYTTRDAFHQWVLKRKRSFETALHISPRKKACDIESPDAHDSDKHIDKKRRVVGPERDEDDRDAVFRLTNELADRVFQKGAEVDVAVTDTADLASLLAHGAVVLGQITDTLEAHDPQEEGRDLGDSQDAPPTDAADSVVEVKALDIVVNIKTEIPAIGATEESTTEDETPSGTPDEARAEKILESLQSSLKASDSANDAILSTPRPCKRKRATSTPSPSAVSKGTVSTPGEEALGIPSEDSPLALKRRREIEGLLD